MTPSSSYITVFYTKLHQVITILKYTWFYLVKCGNIFVLTLMMYLEPKK